MEIVFFLFVVAIAARIVAVRVAKGRSEDADSGSPDVHQSHKSLCVRDNKAAERSIQDPFTNSDTSASQIGRTPLPRDD